MMNENKIYQSPTTPGLHIDFWNLIAESICLNMNSKLPPKFWSEDKYWLGKYKREISVGIPKLKKEMLNNNLDINNKGIKSILINIITKKDIKSLINNKTREKIIKIIKMEYKNSLHNRISNKLDIDNINNENNFKFVDIKSNNKFNRIKDIENGKN